MCQTKDNLAKQNKSRQNFTAMPLSSVLDGQNEPVAIAGMGKTPIFCDVSKHEVMLKGHSYQ